MRIFLCFLRRRCGEYQVTERRGEPGLTGRWRKAVRIPDQALEVRFQIRRSITALPLHLPAPPAMDGMSLAAAILNPGLLMNRALLECRASEATFSRTPFLTSPQSAHHESDSPFMIAQWLQQFLGNGLPQPASSQDAAAENKESITWAGVTLTQEPWLRNPRTQIFPDLELGREMQIHVPPPPIIP